MPVISMTEDQVRNKAKELLNLNETNDAKCGAGQITTFNMLGFPGVTDKPDGWYLPKNVAKPALVLETKASHVSLGDKQVDELQKNIRIVGKRYSKVIGILYNGNDVRVFKGKGMPGHMGHERVTVQNLAVVKVDAENNLILVKGAVPGPKKCLVTIKETVKSGK